MLTHTSTLAQVNIQVASNWGRWPAALWATWQLLGQLQSVQQGSVATDYAVAAPVNQHTASQAVRIVRRAHDQVLRKPTAVAWSVWSVPALRVTACSSSLQAPLTTLTYSHRHLLSQGPPPPSLSHCSLTSSTTASRHWHHYSRCRHCCAWASRHCPVSATLRQATMTTMSMPSCRP